jgi:hypothetical protein
VSEWSGVSLSVIFGKNIWPELRHRIFHKNGMSCVSVNILCDISLCFITLVYMECLVFLRRLKRSGS